MHFRFSDTAQRQEEEVADLYGVFKGAVRAWIKAGLPTLNQKREHWSTISPIRTLFQEAFDRVGLPYFNPHRFRNTLAQLGQKICITPKQLKAWSQNLGHEKVLTTFLSYGEVSVRRQAEIIHGLARPQHAKQSGVSELAKAIAHELRATPQ
jgi:integrase/recombinase XerD